MVVWDFLAALFDANACRPRGKATNFPFTADYDIEKGVDAQERLEYVLRTFDRQ
jgi:hypothetical protein